MPRLPRLLALLALVASGVVACSDVTAPSEDPATTTYAPALNVNIGAMTKTETGLYYQDLIVGGGRTVEATDSIVVRYTGWLTNGSRFDSTGVSKTATFLLGRGFVIQGWEQGLPGAKIGGRRRLIVPPVLGYGFRSFQQIPAGSVLVFDVDIVNAIAKPVGTTPGGST